MRRSEAPPFPQLLVWRICSRWSGTEAAPLRYAAVVHRPTCRLATSQTTPDTAYPWRLVWQCTDKAGSIQRGDWRWRPLRPAGMSLYRVDCSLEAGRVTPWSRIAGHPGDDMLGWLRWVTRKRFASLRRRPGVTRCTYWLRPCWCQSRDFWRLR